MTYLRAHRTGHCICIALLSLAFLASQAIANPPAAKYIFPAGGQRGTTVEAKVGGCYFHGDAGFEMLGPGVQFPSRIRQTDTVWFEGPLIPQPASQRPEDYPKDHACTLKIAADAELGPRAWRAWTSQGATPAMAFVVGDLPEVVEHEIDGTPIPVKVKLPVTINGRIFPRENVDVWTFDARAGQQITCDVNAKRLGSPLDAELELFGPDAKPAPARIVHSEGDPQLHFTAASDGLYRVRIHDVAYGGLQNYVYRLTITADPWVDSVYPLGGRQGTKVRFELTGHALTGLTRALPGSALRTERQFVGSAPRTEDPGIGESVRSAAGAPTGGSTIHKTAGEGTGGTLSEKVADSAQTAHGEIALPADGSEVCRMQFTHAGRKTNLVWIDLDDLPEVLEAEPNDHPADVKPVEIPAVLNGRIDHPGDVDYWAVELKKDHILDLDVRANRLGSPLDSVLSIEDAAGKQLARNDDIAPGQIDSQLTFKAPADGIYYIRIEDRFASRGGSNFAYRLRAAPAEGDFRLTYATDVITAPRDSDHPLELSGKRQQPAGIKVDVQRLGGFTGPINLAIDGLPDGVTATNTTIAARQQTTQIRFTAATSVKIGTMHVRIHGSADIAGKPVSHFATQTPAPGLPPVENILFAVAMPTPFSAAGEYEHPFVPCGSVFYRHYLVDRGGFEGPITVTLSDRQVRHLQAVHGPTMIIPPGAESFDYWVALAPEMELGRTVRVQLQLTGIVKDHDGSEHVVSFSSDTPNNQFVCVATAPLLTVNLEKTSLLATPGRTQDVPIRVQRAQFLVGQPVKLELILPPGMQDVHAESLTLAPNEAQANVRVHFGPHPGPFTLPAILRATTPGPHDPNRAEAKIEFVPAPQ